MKKLAGLTLTLLLAGCGGNSGSVKQIDSQNNGSVAPMYYSTNSVFGILDNVNQVSANDFLYEVSQRESTLTTSIRNYWTFKAGNKVQLESNYDDDNISIDELTMTAIPGNCSYFGYLDEPIETNIYGECSLSDNGFSIKDMFKTISLNDSATTSNTWNQYKEKIIKIMSSQGSYVPTVDSSSFNNISNLIENFDTSKDVVTTSTSGDLSTTDAYDFSFSKEEGINYRIQMSPRGIEIRIDKEFKFNNNICDTRTDFEDEDYIEIEGDCKEGDFNIDFRTSLNGNQITTSSKIYGDIDDLAVWKTGSQINSIYETAPGFDEDSVSETIAMSSLNELQHIFNYCIEYLPKK